MKKILILGLLILMLSCKADKVEAEFIEIKNNLARFDLTNNTNQDVSKITFELKFMTEANELITIDTLSFKMNSEPGTDALPFIKSKDNTFIINQVPEYCEDVEIEILEIEFLN